MKANIPKVELPEPFADKVIEAIIGFEEWIKKNRENFYKKYPKKN